MACGWADKILPLCSPWVFIRALWMTTDYMTWLRMGILGKSWNFGRLDGTQAHRSWPIPLWRWRKEEESFCSVRLRPCAHIRWPWRRSLWSWPRIMTGLQHSTKQQAHMWLISNKEQERADATKSIIPMMIRKAGDLYYCLGTGSTLSV